MSLLAPIVGVLLAPLGAAHYTYHGVVHDRQRVTVALESARVGGGNSHAAVWAGASNHRATVWVQAGIASTGTEPFAYIETRTAGGRHSIRLWPAQFHVPRTVRLLHRGRRWCATILGYRSRWVRILHPNVQAALELYGDAAAVARINGRLVS